jgi:LuxR family maltose regulon positive regulatory protein
LETPVTLLSAGPGYGKTLALADWVNHTSTRVAWLSIEPSDDRLPGFWSALLSSLRQSGAVERATALGRLAPAASFSVEDAAGVVDQLARLDEPLVIVLDDLHRLRDRDVLASIELLVHRLAPTVHVVISARHDPALRLRRLAVEGCLWEIRAEQLAFTAAEAAQLLAEGNLHLTSVTISRLVGRTQGWAAGLRLALAGLDRDDPEHAVDQFRGSDRPVADYLMEEVLDQLSGPDRQFLLRASVADPVSADLAQVLTGVPDAQARLEGVEVGNGFIVGRSGGRTWFSWHPLFREMLSHRLGVEHPREVRELYRRAAHWRLDHGDPLGAIRDLTEAEDWVVIGRILTERVAPDVLTATAPALVQSLAPVAARCDVDPTPPTLLASALCHFHRLDYEAMLSDVVAADAAMGSDTSAASLGADLLIASLRMAYAHAREPSSLVSSANQVLKVVDQLSRLQVPALERYRAIAMTNIGFGLLWDGELHPATTALSDGERACQQWALGLSELTAKGHLALIAALRGQLSLARQQADLALETANEHGWTREPQASAHMIALAMIALDTGRLDEADHLIAIGTRGTNPHVASCVAFAALAVEVALAQRALSQAGRRAAALTALVPRPNDLPPMLAGWVRNVLADHLVARGEIDTARALLNQAPVTGYPQARRAVTLARCLLLREDAAAALRHATASFGECAGYLTTAVDARIVAALAAQRLRRDARALELLAEAIDLAAGHGIRVPFMNAGDHLHPMLQRYRALVARHAAFTASLVGVAPSAQLPVYAPQGADDQLTERERAVLPFLATHLKSMEIANELYLSVNTIKSHQQSIYRKFGVTTRRQAVERARELGLL